MVKRKDYNAKAKNIEDKVPRIFNLPTTAAYNSKINEVKNANKIHKVSDLVKKTDYDAKTSEMVKKYLTTSDYNKFTNNILETLARK